MDKDEQQYTHKEKQAEEASGPRYPDEVGTRNTDQQAHEQRKRSHSAEYYVNEQVNDKGKHRH